jgi:ketosteroid isomerase-like protein
MNRNNSTHFFLALLCALGLTACEQKSAPAPTADTTADAAALATAAEGWEKAYNDKNPDALAALYADDAQLLPPGATEVSGRDAIRAYFVNDIEKHWARITIKSDANGVGGDWGWRSGIWSAETMPMVTGKYIEVWHRSGDGWRLQKDIWNMDAELPEGGVPEITVH